MNENKLNIKIILQFSFVPEGDQITIKVNIDIVSSKSKWSFKNSTKFSCIVLFQVGNKK